MKTSKEPAAVSSVTVADVDLSAPRDAPFADVLRGLREARALTQEELADRAGLTVKAVGALERGERRRPYPHTVRALSDALGLDDADRAALVAAVPSRGARGSGVAPAPSASGPAAPAPTPLLGRERELAAVAALVRGGRRLITLTGPGGVGKTRLALQLAADLGSAFDGVAVVELATVRDARLVLPQVASALGVPEPPGRTTAAAFVPSLAGRRILLVLDNLEQVPGCAPDVADLVARCPDLVVLATSRAPLRVRAEHEVVVAPLALPGPDAGGPAVELFVERARAAGAPDAVGDDTAAIAEICARLDGLPLAIELAAAAGRLLTPRALLGRLDRVDGIALRGPVDLPDRQRTMTAALDWSHDLLGEPERTWFARLSVFAGGFGVEDAEALAGPDEDDDVVGILAELTDQSLVQRVPDVDGQPRLRLLEPVRQYAERRLAADPDEAAAVADRHALHYAHVASQAYHELHGPSMIGQLDRLEADHANLRAALAQLQAGGRAGEAAHAVHAVWLYLGVRGHAREGLAWAEALAAVPLDDHARCAAHIALAGLLFVTGDVPRMTLAAATALDLARVLDDDDLVAESAFLLGSAHAFAGDVARAVPLLDEAAGRARRSGGGWVEVHVLIGNAQLALLGGRLDEARRLVPVVERAARDLGNAFTLAVALNVRTTLTELDGDHRTSALLLAEATELSVRAGSRWTLVYALPGLAAVAARLGEAETAVRLFGASASLTAVHDVDLLFPASREMSDAGLSAVRSTLGEAAFRTAWDAGRSLGADEIIELAARLTRAARA